MGSQPDTHSDEFLWGFLAYYGPGIRLTEGIPTHDTIELAAAAMFDAAVNLPADFDYGEWRVKDAQTFPMTKDALELRLYRRSAHPRA